jgi:hypothetical protein
MRDYRLRSLCLLDNINGGNRILRVVFSDANNGDDTWNYDMGDIEEGIRLENFMANLEEAHGMLEIYLNDQKATEE